MKLLAIFLTIIILIIWGFSIVDYTKVKKTYKYKCTFPDQSSYHVKRYKQDDKYIIDLEHGGIFYIHQCEELQ